MLTQLSYSQKSKRIQIEFDNQVKEIDLLAKNGKITEAIKKAELTKIYTAENFKNSNDKLKTILFKLNFYYRVINDEKNELKTNIELGKLRKDDLELEKASYREFFEKQKDFYNSGYSTERKKRIFKEANERLVRQAERVLEQRFTDEKQDFIKNNLIPFFNLYHSFAYKHNYNLKFFNSELINNSNLIKGALLNSSRNIVNNLRALNSPKLNNKLENYVNQKEFLALQLCLPKSKQVENIRVYKERTNAFESDLLIQHELNFKGKPKRKTNWQKIKNTLEDDEIVIDFSHFRLITDKVTDSVIYIAQIYKKEWMYAKIVPLFEKQQLLKFFDKNTKKEVNNLRGSEGVSSNKSDSEHELFKLIFNPIKKYLKGTDKVYISPDGLLHQIAFSSLLNDDNKRLIECYKIQRISSPKVILNKKSSIKKEYAFITGGIKYNNDNTLPQKDYWSFLEGTSEEIDYISDLLKNKFISTKKMSGNDATESAIKNLSGEKFNIIHIATHGYFFENQNDNNANNDYALKDILKTSNNPLLRSGLIFAGANEAWTKGANLNSEDDGILTALEISNLDLSNTDLVVLSACETGLGDIDGSEGVYGLQRAFKMAGVDLIIMSLWEVPDTETAEFMQSFYSNWLSGQDIRQAFRNTQLTMVKKYEDNPEKWAAFVLFE